MSTLLAEAFDNSTSTLTQEIRVDDFIRLAGFRPLLVFINPPDTASLTLGLYDENDTLINSKTQTWAEIKTASDNDSEATSLNATYAYGYVKFAFNNSYQLAPVNYFNKKYTLKLTRNDSYTYSDSNFIGWCKSYGVDNSKVYTLDGYGYSDDVNAPFEFELYINKKIDDSF